MIHGVAKPNVAKKCESCNGTGKVFNNGLYIPCPKCHGLGMEEPDIVEALHGLLFQEDEKPIDCGDYYLIKGEP